MITGCPRTLVAPSAAALANKSLAPPDANGTMKRTGLLGHVLATLLVCAQPLLTSKVSAANASPAVDLGKTVLRLKGQCVMKAPDRQREAKLSADFE
jgi:hypothetical protein